MNFGFDIVHPLDLNSQLAAKDIDSCGFKIVIDCTGNPTAVEKVNVHKLHRALTALRAYPVHMSNFNELKSYGLSAS